MNGTVFFVHTWFSGLLAREWEGGTYACAVKTRRVGFSNGTPWGPDDFVVFTTSCAGAWVVGVLWP